MAKTSAKVLTSASLIVGLVAGAVFNPGMMPARAVGPMVTPMAPASIKSRVFVKKVNRYNTSAHKHIVRVRISRKTAAKPKPVARALSPLSYVSQMSNKELAPGVIWRNYRGALNINLVDVDCVHSPYQIRPILSGDSFNQLSGVTTHARRTGAIAAVNANYFKKDGTPLGTLIVDGEWVSGPIFDRVSLGLNSAGYVRIDRVNLHGILETSNPEVPSVWVNNINQPRRSGCRMVVYTRRWGSDVRLPYSGNLVAVSSQGQVVDTDDRYMSIPYGGYVLSDSKDGAIGKLKRGDIVHVSWKARPNEWEDIVHAVSGGPMLVKNGEIYLDCADERFRANWTSASIHARTAVGVTADNHLLLLTVEGPHTLWDVAKFLQHFGAVEAMNLDGGGSTTMVVNGVTVTRNKSDSQRRVANSLAIVPCNLPQLSGGYNGRNYRPTQDLVDFCAPVIDESLDLANNFSVPQVETSVIATGKVVEQPVVPILEKQLEF